MELLESLLNLLSAVYELVVALVRTALPLWPLVAWIAFWLLAVNWQKLRVTLNNGGWIGVLLIGILMVIIWGCVSPPAGGQHEVLGLRLSNFVGKTVYVTGLIVFMFLCGSIQLAGVVDRCLHFAEPEPEEHGHGHGHDHDGGHGNGHAGEHAHAH